MTASVWASAALCSVVAGLAVREARRASVQLWLVVGAAYASNVVVAVTGELASNDRWGFGRWFGGWSVHSAAVLMAATAALRPLLGWPPRRDAARVFGTSVLVASIGVLFAGAGVFEGPSVGDWRDVGLGAAAVGVFGAALSGCALAAGRARWGRVTELVVLAAVFIDLSIGLGVAYFAVSSQWWLVAPAGSASVMVVALVARRSGAVGTAFGDGHVVAEVRSWSAVAAYCVGGACAATTQFFVGIVEPLIAVVVLGAAVGFNARELSGGYQPLRVPFTSRERAVHAAFRDVMSGDVRLVGRLVRRTSDDATVAIEADVDWSRSRRRSGRLVGLRVAAREARVERALDPIVVGLGLAHAPAVLHTLTSGEPWISVPVSLQSFGAPSALPVADDACDGLVLRINEWPVDAAVQSTLARWQERGAAIHLEQTPAMPIVSRFEPDVVTVDLPPVARVRRPGHPVTLRRVATRRDRRIDGADLVVDMAERPVDLGVLLSRIAVRQPGEYVRRVSFE